MNFEFDVALSFASEDREFVDEVARILRDNNIKVFYDKFEEVDLWGKDLGIHFDYVYRRSAKYCIPFISEYYKKKLWTNYEIRNAIARAVESKEEYILPAKFDDTEIEGLRSTIAYLDLRTISPAKLAGIVIQKLRNANQAPVIEELHKRGAIIYFSCNLIKSAFGFGAYGSVGLGVRITNTMKEHRYFDEPCFKITQKVNDREVAFYLTERLVEGQFPAKLEYGQTVDVMYELKRGATELWKNVSREVTMQAVVTTTIGERYYSNELKLSDLDKAFSCIL